MPCLLEKSDGCSAFFQVSCTGHFYSNQLCVRSSKIEKVSMLKRVVQLHHSYSFQREPELELVFIDLKLDLRERMSKFQSTYYDSGVDIIPYARVSNWIY